ncbi:MAG: UvrD-helicase domain-containing protein [bacterium]|nr:MAG: UvrD-helicase domain-containing protein [bacterium]
MQNLSEKQLLALDLSRNLAVTAGAGSGKTSVLVNRYLHILLHFTHLSVKELLAITFTEKATAEMKDRIFDMIRQQYRENRSQQGRLFEILNEIHETQIFTIHAFCSHLLRQYPLESGLNPDFSILSEVETAELLHRMFREFLGSFDVKSHPQSKVMLRTFREFSPNRLLEMLTFFYHKRTQLFQFLETFAQKSPQEIQRDWQKTFQDYHQHTLQPLLNNTSFWNDLRVLSEWKTDPHTTGFEVQSQLKHLLDHYQKSPPDDVSRIISFIQIIDLLTKGDHGAYSAVPGGKKSWGEDGVNLFKNISVQAAGIASLLIPYESDIERTFSSIQKGLALIVLEFFRQIENEKLRLNVLDFDDLLIHTLKLVHSFPEIHTHLRKQYKFILVDEYQDTDLLQDSLVHLFCHDHLGNMDPNKVFIVGDPKQSIFGFRNADVSLFQTFMTEISSQVIEHQSSEPARKNDQKSDGIIVLDQNYRSNSQLIQFFNKTFQPIFRRDSEFDVEYQALQTTREDRQGKIPVVKLDIFPEEKKERTEEVIKQVHQIAQSIQHITDNSEFLKFKGPNHDPTYEKLEFGDIAVLIRSRTHLNRLEQIFRQHEIPYQTYKGVGFFHRQEVQDIYYLLRSSKYPEDDFALITVLRSDFIGLSDITLFYLNQIQGSNYWDRLHRMRDALQSDHIPLKVFDKKFAQFLQETGQKITVPELEKDIIETILSLYPAWHQLAVNGEYSKLLDNIIERLNIRVLLRYQTDGLQKLANLDKMIHTIFEYENQSSLYSTDLLDILKKQISGEIQEGEAIIFAEEENKVKIITYHSAKGMEFPVVFLPLLETSFQYNRQLLWDNTYGFSFLLERSGNASDKKSFAYNFLKNRDRQNIYAEEKRLFYVAATRAKDYLFLLGTTNKDLNPPQDSYLHWLFEAHDLYGDISPEFTDERGIRIRLHDDQAEDLAHVQSPDVTKFPMRDRKTLTARDIKNIYPLRVEPDLQTYSVTQLMIFREDKDRYFQHFYLHDGQLKLSSLNREFIDEPGGALWGSLIHKMLEDFYLRSPADDQHKIKQLLQLFEFENNEKNIQQKLLQILDQIRHERFAQSLDPKETYSEFSVELRLEHFILKGIFDVLYKNSRGIWEIIDYKTNRIKASETASLVKKYSFQMKTYALLLANIFPDQQIYPVSLLFTEPMKKEEYTFNVLEIEEVRLETLGLLNQLFEFEASIFRPGSSTIKQKNPENKK